MKPGQVDLNRAHANDTLIETMRSDLASMPIDKDRIDSHQAKPATHAQGREHAGFAEADDGNIHRAAYLQKARFLEVADDERIISRAFRFQRITNLCAAQRNSVNG